MSIIISIFGVFFLLLIFNIWLISKKFQLAHGVLELIHIMRKEDIISGPQAKVYLNEMNDPMNSRAIMEVYQELREIYEKHKSSDR